MWMQKLARSAFRFVGFEAGNKVAAFYVEIKPGRLCRAGNVVLNKNPVFDIYNKIMKHEV